ncbi:TonB-dependent receptor, beta-barrel domain protein [mine drainage metagenome]|uniref:TonB-dependent receptor, beta-barrel domain protein n=1 Tax=mine drainage metagenome TaxID=410659 RepID=T0YLY7_9ZZZZ
MLTHEQRFGDHWRFYGKAWVGTSELTQRVANPAVPPQPQPTVTNIQDARFRYVGTDLRLRHDFGPGDTFTFGTVLYHSDAPLRGANYTNLLARAMPPAACPRWCRGGIPTTPRCSPAACSLRAAASLAHRALAAARSRKVSVFETVRPPNLSRPLLNTTVSRTVPLFGLGIGNDFFDHGHLNETYFNVSTGWRPVRYFDIGSPHANIIPGTAPAVQKVLSYELGVHGTPVDGLFYDASVFWMDFHNRIETINLSPIVSIEQNSGDTHNEGFEGELAYDFLHGDANGEHLEAFVNLQLLHARFVASAIPNQVGKPPAYSPRHLAKAGVTWRRDGHYKLAFTGVFSGSQYWQDSAQDQPGVGGTVLLPALIPAYSVWDFAANWNLAPRVELLGGVSNVFNRVYYSRVWTYGIEPALSRTWYAGFKLSL